MRSLVIGMGIGQLYKRVLENMGHEVITVDPDINKGAMLPSTNAAILAHAPFDVTVICTPNIAHEELATVIAPHSRIVMVEKPGFNNSASWLKLVRLYRNTRFMMVKNNQWRSNIDELQKLALESSEIQVNWINKDRIPNPGSWFTTKELAFGGVSRDLMPHLLSIFLKLETFVDRTQVTKATATQNWQLSDLTNTDYGTINPNGIYDVDDHCEMHISIQRPFATEGRLWHFTADWRSNVEDKVNIEFTNKQTGVVTAVDLGLCPEEAYQSMIQDALDNVDFINFWQKQLEHDVWIHQRIEKL